MKFYVKNLAAIAFCFGLASICAAQDAPASQAPTTPASADQPAAPPAAPAAPAPLPTPAITGPLSGLPPAIFDAGPFGKIAVNGIVSGLGLPQSNHVPSDDPTRADLSTEQGFLQKTHGWFHISRRPPAATTPAPPPPFLLT